MGGYDRKEDFALVLGCSRNGLSKRLLDALFRHALAVPQYVFHALHLIEAFLETVSAHPRQRT